MNRYLIVINSHFGAAEHQICLHSHGSVPLLLTLQKKKKINKAQTPVSLTYIINIRYVPWGVELMLMFMLPIFDPIMEGATTLPPL